MLTRFMADIGTLLLGRDRPEIARARYRAIHNGQAIIGFAAGCAVGAAREARFGMWLLVLPTGIALFTVALGLVDDLVRGGPR